MSEEELNEEQSNEGTEKRGDEGAELEEAKNRLLRALADFDNYKKRTAVEREQFALFANEQLIRDILPILDNFGRAIETASKDKAAEGWLKGVALVEKQLEDVLKKFGVTPIEALGKHYDPHFHEAIMQKESDGQEGINIEELQTGYLLNGRLIRPAMVIVSKKSKSLNSKS